VEGTFVGSEEWSGYNEGFRELELGDNSLGAIMDSLVFSINNILNLSTRVFAITLLMVIFV
jgi:hypothetical protein